MKLDNYLISAGGAGQFTDPNAINDMSRLVPTININYPLNHAGGAAQIPQANAINVGSWLIPPIGIHNPSSHAGGAAQFPQAHTMNNKSRPLIEGMAMILDSSPISAGGAGQFPEPNATNDMSWLVPTVNIDYPSNHARGAAQIPQAHATIANSQPLIEGTDPYSAFKLSLDKHHVLIESEKVAR